MSLLSYLITKLGHYTRQILLFFPSIETVNSNALIGTDELHDLTLL